MFAIQVNISETAHNFDTTAIVILMSTVATTAPVGGFGKHNLDLSRLARRVRWGNTVVWVRQIAKVTVSK